MEIELKLLVDPADADRLLRCAALRGDDKPQKKHLENIYFDTPDGQLQAARIGLRLRRDGERWLQTLKGGGGIVGGLHARHEIEYPVAGPQLDFAGLAGSPWAKYFTPTLAASLAPVFHTDFHRTIRLVRIDNAVIELALDRGEVRAGQSSEPICEVELELLSGPLVALYTLARQLLEVVPLRLENASKAERGYRLAAGVKLAAPRRADCVTLQPELALRDAFIRVAQSMVSHWQANENGFLLRPDEPEYLHQIRVAVRRLRAWLSTFGRGLLPKEDLAWFRGELRWLGAGLGLARDWDVLLADNLPVALAQFAGHPAEAALRHFAATAADEARQNAQALLQSRRYQALLLAFGRQFALLADTVTGGPVAGYVTDALETNDQKLRKRLQRIDSGDAAALHRTRILVKRQRYLLEATASLFGGKRFEAYLAWLRDWQERLGNHNDLLLAASHLKDLRAAAGTLDEAELCGLLQGWLRGVTSLPPLLEPPPQPFWT